MNYLDYIQFNHNPYIYIQSVIIVIYRYICYFKILKFAIHYKYYTIQYFIKV